MALETRQTVFDFRDYKKYVAFRLEKWSIRGAKSALALKLGCQPAFVSQILYGSSQMSPEQADKTNDFLGHTKEEAHVFILLVQFARAGTESLKRYYEDQIKSAQEQYLSLNNRIQSRKVLPEEIQSIYYSKWYYTAIHIAISLPNLQTKEALANYFHLPLTQVTEALTFLEREGLITAKGEMFQVGKTRLYVGSDSPFSVLHHSNWRVRAIQNAQIQNSRDLHCTSIVSLSEEDTQKVKELLIKSIEGVRAIVHPSKDETLRCFSLDFFEV